MRQTLRQDAKHEGLEINNYVTYFSGGLSSYLGSAHDIQRVIELFIHLQEEKA